MSAFTPMGHAISWLVLGGVSVPAVVVELKDGKHTATSPDWRVTTEPCDTPTEALQALTRELEQRVWEALEKSRREAAVAVCVT